MTFKNLSQEELIKIIASKEKIILIDVRTEKEHNKEKIPNTNFLIPFNEIESRHKEINNSLKEKEKIILYCRSGNRSEIATQTLSRLGYQNIFNLEKGIKEWKKYNKIEKPLNQKNSLKKIISIFRR